jgi:hypothetical protein
LCKTYFIKGVDLCSVVKIYLQFNNNIKMKPKKLLTTLAIVSVVLMAGCKKDNYVPIVGKCPIVISTNPASNAINVPLAKIVASATTVTATFNEKMDATTINGASFTVTGATQLAGTVSYADSTASFTPTGALTANTTYTGRIKSTVKDLMGNALQTDYVWAFSTGAILVPVVISTDPANNAVNVVLNKTITATFSIPMDSTTLTTSTFTLKHGSSVVLGVVSYSGTTVSFNPTSNLSSDTTYTATITTGAKNKTGVALAANYVWKFTAGAILAPTVISTDPANNAISVVLTKTITATFSTAMDSSTLTGVTFTLKNGATSVLGTILHTGSTASFKPSSNLLPGTVYTATITTGAKNLAGTALAANKVWTFTTASLPPPTVISTNPANGDTAVVLTKKVTATFSVPMDSTTLTIASFTLKHGATAVLGTISHTGSTATFNPSANLIAGTTYTATITTVAKNLSGTPLAANYVWTFTTVGAIYPKVISTDPLNLATGVALNKVISATFSVPMDGSTITTSTFTIMMGATVVNGTVNYAGSTATFTPSPLLLSDTVYTATISIGAKSAGGVSLATDYVWTFRTVAHKGPIAPNLASVARFGIIAGVGVSNDAGFSVINNLDVGISPGALSSVTGFFVVDGGPGIINNGNFYAADAGGATTAMLIQAQNDLTAAYNFAKGATSPAPTLAPPDLGGQTLAPGIYYSTSTMLLQNGNLTLDAQGDANAVWIFQVGSSFTSVGGSPFPSPSGGNVILAGGAQAKNVYWQVSVSATIGDYTNFYGNVMALTTITMNPYAVATGRMLARNGAVTMTSTNIINKP